MLAKHVSLNLFESFKDNQTMLLKVGLLGTLATSSIAVPVLPLCC